MLDRVRHHPNAHGARKLRLNAYPKPASLYGSGTEDVGAYPGESDHPARLDLRRLWSCLLHYRLLIGAFLLAGLVAGVALFTLQTPIYRATMRIEISAPAARVVRDLEVVAEATDVRAFQTAMERLKSRNVIERAMLALHLADSPDFLFPRPRFSPARVLARITGRTSEAWLEPLDSATRERMAVNRIRTNLSVSMVRNTSILTLAYRDSDPGRATAIVNQIADSYLDQRMDQTSRTSLVARQFVEDQVAEIKKKLQHSEAELVAYAKQQGIAVTGGEGSLIEQNIRALNEGFAEAIKERLGAEGSLQQIEAGHGEELEAVLKNETALDIRAA